MNSSKNKYYVVSSEILPDVLDKVMKAQHLLMTGQVSRISEAVKIVGISRGTFYKYKDAFFSFHEEDSRRKAILNMVIHDEKGVLSRILSGIAEEDCNLLAINQTIPINQITNVSATLDIADMEISIHELISKLEALECVETVQLVAIE